MPEQIRYTFYSRTAGLIEAPSLPQILCKASLEGGGVGTEGPRVFSDLLKDGCFWIDILDPSDFDMQILSKVNNIQNEILFYVPLFSLPLVHYAHWD